MQELTNGEHRGDNITGTNVWPEIKKGTLLEVYLHLAGILH